VFDVPTLGLIFTALGLIVTIIYATLNHRQQQKVIYQQALEIQELKKGQRLELIDKYYPPLTENLRLSIPDVAQRYLQGYREHGNYFEELVDMENQSTLRYIQGIDEELYNNLRRILDHFFPEEWKIDRKKDESWKEVPRKWQKWIEDNYYELPKWHENINPETLAKVFANSIRYAIWNRDEMLLRQNVDRAFKDHFRLEDEKKFTVSHKRIFEEIVRIAEDEWNPIKEEYDKLQKEIKVHVESEILPSMDATLRSLGEQ
jgi:uncharacterized protein (DUF2249 family)